MEGSEVTHEDGRECTYNSDGVWTWMGPNPGTPHSIPTVCDRDHPSTDRGDFGMPGLGAGRVPQQDLPGKVREVEATWKPMPGRVQEITLMPRLVVNEDGITVDYGEQAYTVDAATDDARYALGLLPDILTQFLEKNRKYALVEDGYDLGEQGIIPDLNRKLGILVDRIWHGRPEIGESTDEVIGDLIGHLFLMLAKRREG